MNRDNAMQQAVVDELIVFLDAQYAEFLETLDRLNRLRAAVIRRDEAALTQLLDSVQQDADQRRDAAAAQAALEQRLMTAVDGLEPPITLSRVCQRLDSGLVEPLRQRQRLLLETAGRIQNELEATEMLLRECARCNRELLGVILGHRRQPATYDPQGRNAWDMQRGLVSVTL